MRAATRGRLTCHQPRRGRRIGLGSVSGVHGHVEPGPAIVAGRVAALFGGREAAPQNFRDAAGSLGGCGDDTDLGYPCRRHRFCRSHASLSVRRGAHGVRRRLTPTAASHGTLASSPPSSCCPRRVADVRRDDPSRPTAGLPAPARHRCSGKLASLSFPPGGTTAKRNHCQGGAVEISRCVHRTPADGPPNPHETGRSWRRPVALIAFDGRSVRRGPPALRGCR